MVKSRFEPGFSPFFLKVEETPELWAEEECSGRNPGGLSRPCGAHAVVASESL